MRDFFPSGRWDEAVQKLLNTDKIGSFGIMHKYGSYILDFHCHVFRTYAITYTFISLINLSNIKLKHAKKEVITGTHTHFALSCLGSLLHQTSRVLPK